MTPRFLKSSEGTFKASPQRLFRAWTDKTEIIQWFGSEEKNPDVVENDPKVGGDWKVEFHAEDGKRDVLFGRYITVEPGFRLAFSWRHRRHLPDGTSEATAESQVTVTFEAQGDKTRMRLVHEAIQRKEGRLGVSDGWSDSFAKLARLMESDA